MSYDNLLRDRLELELRLNGSAHDALKAKAEMDRLLVHGHGDYLRHLHSLPDKSLEERTQVKKAVDCLRPPAHLDSVALSMLDRQLCDIKSAKKLAPLLAGQVTLEKHCLFYRVGKDEHVERLEKLKDKSFFKRYIRNPLHTSE